MSEAQNRFTGIFAVAHVNQVVCDADLDALAAAQATFVPVLDYVVVLCHPSPPLRPIAGRFQPQRLPDDLPATN